ncbi:MAG: histidine ammonia-lyase 2 [Candidatus Sericytochromatia bacterium]|nr:MAG: histidine ammonia-lyase 2 [Candidatus Sericytochromatia bacterium]
MNKEFYINGSNLNLKICEKIINNNYKIYVSNDCFKVINKSRKVVEDILKENRIVYGINTGFGFLKNKIISNKDIEKLQENLILSHSVGVGDYLDIVISKLMLLLRANALCKGYSGVRIDLINKILEFFNNNIIPVIPSQGSVGASGDLAPLSHMALAIIGKGKVFYKKKIFYTEEVLKKLKIEPIKLEAKEGLALINGTQFMSSIAVYVLIKALKLIDIADVISAITLDALKGTSIAFKKELHIIRNHKGQIQSANNLYKLLQDSEIAHSHKNCNQVQDAYSLRCIPQVHGAVRDSIDYCKNIVEIEINSVTDNPIILPDTNEVISCGNFHGEPIAISMDLLGIALSELGNISERRSERLLNPNLNNGLPAFLSNSSGINSGFMIAQYTAASLVSENKVLSHPASVDSIPTSANQEDHVSMGSISARKCLNILKNLEYILSIELLCSCQAIDFRKPLKTSDRLQSIYNLVRENVNFLSEDRIIYEDINKIKNLINSSKFYNQIKKILK